MNKKQKKVLTRIIIASVLMIILVLLPLEDYPLVRFILFMVPYFTVGYDILLKAFKGIKNKQVFDENFLMAIATVGAIALGEYTELRPGAIGYGIQLHILFLTFHFLPP